MWVGTFIQLLKGWPGPISVHPNISRSPIIVLEPPVKIDERLANRERGCFPNLGKHWNIFLPDLLTHGAPDRMGERDRDKQEEGPRDAHLDDRKLYSNNEIISP